MITLSLTEKGGETSTLKFDQPEVSIGRIQGNDIVLAKSNISKRHARIVNNDGTFVVIDAKSTNGTYINGKRIDAPYDLRAGDKIFVGDFTIEVSDDAKKAPPPPPKPDEASNSNAPVVTKSAVVTAAKDDLLSDDEWAKDKSLKDDWQDDWGTEEAQAKGVTANHDFDASSFAPEALAVLKAGAKPPRPPLEDAFPVPTSTKQGPTPDVTKKGAAPAAPAAKKAKEPEVAPAKATQTQGRAPAPKAPVPAPAAPERSKLGKPSNHGQALRLVHEKLIRSLDLRRMGVERMNDQELSERTRQAVRDIISGMEDAGELPSGVDVMALEQDVLHEAIGLGPLEDLLQDETVTEILVNSAQQIYVERNGKLQLSDRTFSSEQAVLAVIERIVAPIGRRIDESSPMVDARLKDGSRVNAVVPPLALKGPCLTIRKFTREPLLIDDLVAFGTVSAEIADFLEVCVKARKNIVISGGTGSGKTTTLNVLSSFIPSHERILTIEDAAELKLEQEHVVSLETRPPNIEGKGAIGIRELVRNALRMRPDRIVVGECRGGEALDMLQAMNTGHDGSLTTVHANGPRDALSRLETMVLMSGMELPIRAIRDQIASAVDIVVQQTRFPDGSRRITHVSEITGMEGDVIAMQDIFLFEQRGFDADGKVKGSMRPTGMIPKFYESLKAMGIQADLGIFQNT